MFLQPSIEILLKRFDFLIELLPEDYAIELVEHGPVEALDKSIRLRMAIMEQEGDTIGRTKGKAFSGPEVQSFTDGIEFDTIPPSYSWHSAKTPKASFPDYAIL